MNKLCVKVKHTLSILSRSSFYGTYFVFFFFVLFNKRIKDFPYISFDEYFPFAIRIFTLCFCIYIAKALDCKNIFISLSHLYVGNTNLI